jgi:serine/threonine-protein kinase
MHLAAGFWPTAAYCSGTIRRVSVTVGETFAGYTILRLLGSGGMAEVYLAQHPRLPRRDALKVMSEAITADTDFRERFHREADLAATLWHPHIVGVHDRGEFNGRLWISMDYVEGTDAGQLVKNRFPAGMPIQDVCAVVAAVAEGLDYAHKRGLLHRDVKPANILLTEPEDGKRRILLADFGIARPLGDISGLTATNFTVGTLSYAAPEQLMGAEIDGRADQYALAATAFHLLTGAPPFQHPNPVAVISQHLNVAPPKLGDRRPEFAHLDQVLSTALSKDPAGRFDRCRDFAKALNERAGVDYSESDHSTEADLTVAAPIVGSNTQVAVPSDRPGSNTEPPPTAATQKRRRRSRILFAAAVAAAVLTIVAVIGYMIQPTKHTTTPAPSTATPPAAVLDGSYRLDYDNAKTTQNGEPQPQPKSQTTWWAFHSSCDSTGCTATGTKLDDDNHETAHTPADTAVLQFTDGHWEAAFEPFQAQVDHCLGQDGKVVAGQDTAKVRWSFGPQPDGTLRGNKTVTVLTNHCGIQGAVTSAPVTATRMGPVPSGVTVADPATVPSSATPSTAATVFGGPALDGTYRLDYDYVHQTVNGAPGHGSLTTGTDWFAFHSACTASGCAASGAKLGGADHKDNTGVVEVLHFIDDHWRDTPYLQPPIPSNQCSGDSGTVADTETISWSLQPQPDGTLRGTITEAVLSNECGKQGKMWATPTTATRVGDVPPGVVLGDPALFTDPALFDGSTTPGPRPGG